MVDFEYAKKKFKNHIAKFTDYGNIKILDFKNPNSSDYRIRFLFEEDYHKLHISGDLGELIATNYTNMTYEGFKDFIDNIGYFEGKIDCMSKRVYFYDRLEAKKALLELVDECNLGENIHRERPYLTEEEALDMFADDVLYDFSKDIGIRDKGFYIATDHIPDFWENVSHMGRRRTGIIELYMMAFEMATKQ